MRMRRLLWLLPAFFVLVAAAIALPGWLRPQLEAAGIGLCPLCRLEIGSLSWHLFPAGIRARAVRFQSGDPRDSAVSFAADEVLVPVPLGNLLRHHPLRLGFLEASGVHVLVHEGDAHLPAAPGRKADEGAGFEAEGIAIRDATFEYRKDSPAGAAWLRLHRVSAVGGPFGTSRRLRDQPLLARATATLERSGDVTLVVAAKYFVSPAWADVDLRLAGQRLAEVNGYFAPEEGVTLRGRLRESHGVVSVRGPRAEGRVRLRFDGLGLAFHRNRHRGGLSALLDNLAVRIKVKGTNLDDPPEEAVKAVVTSRHAKESAVGFVLRTLREAALRVATD